MYNNTEQRNFITELVKYFNVVITLLCVVILFLFKERNHFSEYILLVLVSLFLYYKFITNWEKVLFDRGDYFKGYGWINLISLSFSLSFVVACYAFGHRNEILSLSFAGVFFSTKIGSLFLYYIKNGKTFVIHKMRIINMIVPPIISAELLIMSGSYDALTVFNSALFFLFMVIMSCQPRLKTDIL